MSVIIKCHQDQLTEAPVGEVASVSMPDEIGRGALAAISGEVFVWLHEIRSRRPVGPGLRLRGRMLRQVSTADGTRVDIEVEGLHSGLNMATLGTIAGLRELHQDMRPRRTQRIWPLTQSQADALRQQFG